jgi:outer membrane protein assembly factor BamB
MFKRIPFVFGSILMGGCAALMNSGRPSYHGPIAKPLWHDSSLLVDEPPVIADGRIYAAGRTGHDNDRAVMAFDGKSGAVVWRSNVAGKKVVLAAGTTLVVTDEVELTRLLDARTGNQLPTPPMLKITHAVAADGVMYAVNGNTGLEARPLTAPGEKTLWKSNLPMKPLGHVEDPTPHKYSGSLNQKYLQTKIVGAPVIAGGTVFVEGYSDFDLDSRTPALSGIYAFDARTGEMRWKWELEDRHGTYTISGIAADEAAAYVWFTDKSKDSFGIGVLAAVDAATGKEMWRHTSSTSPGTIYQPVLLDPNLVLSCEYPPGSEGTATNTGHLFPAFDRATGAKQWESRTPWKYQGGTIDRDVLLASDHKIHEVLNENNNSSPDSWVSAVNLRTGKELWRSPEVELGVFTLPAAGDGIVAVGSAPYTWSSPPRAGKRSVAGVWAWRIAP